MKTITPHPYVTENDRVRENWSRALYYEIMSLDEQSPSQGRREAGSPTYARTQAAC